MIDNGITKLDQATRMLAEIATIDDAKNLIDLAEAARVYARQVQLGLEAQNHAAEIKVRAQRRAGEILDSMDKNKGVRLDGKNSDGSYRALPEVSTEAPTYDELGINYKQAHQWQTIAGIPEYDFEEMIAETKGNGDEITTAGIYRVAKNLLSGIDEDVLKAKQAMSVTTYSHNSLEYYTPAWVLDAAREVMGGIDLDPASCDEAQANVNATEYYTVDDDGLSRKWSGRVWLNPPYSKTDGRSNQDIWSQRLIEEYKAGNVTEAVLLVKAALGYKWFEQLFDTLPVCLMRERLSFILDDGNDEGQSKQGTAIFYMGNNFNRFYEVFRKYGRVIPTAEVLDGLLSK